MIALFSRLDELLRPRDEERGSPAERLGIDLSIAAFGLFAFGLTIPAAGDLLFRGWVGLKVAAAFLITFVVILGPLYAIQRFFEVEAPFGAIVGALARHLALGGLFAGALAGVYGLVRRGDPTFDGPLALGFVAALIGLVLAFRQRGRVWLPRWAAALAVLLFLSVLGQSAWAFRPYLDPRGPTLFEAQAEWLTGDTRSELEAVIQVLGRASGGESGP